MFHVKQFEDDGRFEPRRGRVSGLEPGLMRLLGWCAALLVLPVERVVRLLGMERLFHVKIHVYGAGICSRCSLKVRVLLDSMNRRCPSMRFYGAKMGVYEL